MIWPEHPEWPHERHPAFEKVFIEQGRVACESWFGIGRNRVNRWLEEAGKDGLIEERRKFIKAKRANDRNRELRELPSKPEPAQIDDPRKIDPKLADMACRFLQGKDGGRWVCYRCDDNPEHFTVGVLRFSAAQMLDKAKARGFDEARALHQIKVFGES